MNSNINLKNLGNKIYVSVFVLAALALSLNYNSIQTYAQDKKDIQTQPVRAPKLPTSREEAQKAQDFEEKLRKEGLSKVDSKENQEVKPQAGGGIVLTSAIVSNGKYTCFPYTDLDSGKVAGGYSCVIYLPIPDPNNPTNNYYNGENVPIMSTKFTTATNSTTCDMFYGRNYINPDPTLYSSAQRILCENVPGAGTTGVSATGIYDIDVIVNGTTVNPLPLYSSTRIIKDFNSWAPSSATTNTEIEQKSDPSLNKLYQSILGTDTKLYTRSTADGTNWTPWTDGLSGITMKSEPKMEYFAGKLYQIAYGTDNRLYTRTYTEGTDTWTGWREGDGVTIAAKPETAVRGDFLFITVKGTDNKVYTRVIRSDHTSFSSWVEGNRITVKTSPKMVAMDQYTLFQIAWGTDNQIYMRNFGNIDASLSGDWRRLGDITVGSNPEVIANSMIDNDSMSIYARGMDSKIYAYFDPQNCNCGWTAGPSFTGVDNSFRAKNSPSAFEALAYSDSLFLSDSSNKFYETLNVFGPSSGITVISKSQEDLFKGRVYQVVAGTDKKVWTRSRN